MITVIVVVSVIVNTNKRHNNTNVNKTSKKKKTNQASESDRAQFSSMVDALSEVEAPHSPDSPTQERSGGSPSYVPQDAAERSAWMLKKLEQLYADILAGEPTAAAEDLRAALAADVIDRDALPEHLRRLVDEIDVRSAVEIAKLEVSKKA